ncbi:MAG TPA: hypothetical protein VFY39_04450 [Gammaproteobacteria bacterium]|nr:hypothetical protein [Gammaproteobacteria bacterium]
MSLFEIEFESRLERFERDSRACASFTYTELTFQHLIDTDWELARQIGRHTDFWRRIRSAQRSAVFAALSRIYDESRTSNSAGQFLRFAEKHKERFCARRFPARWPLEPPDFRPLFDELDRQRKFYRRRVEPAGAQLFDGFEEDGSATNGELIEKLGAAAFGELAVFPLRLRRALERLFREGTPPALENVPISVSELLSAGASIQAAAWEHERVARTVADFLRFGRLASPIEQRAASPRELSVIP